MICQRCGYCCFSYLVIIPVKKGDAWMAASKSCDGACPHLIFDDITANCAVHKLPLYKDSPCDTYGNADVDPDFDRGPCRVGTHIMQKGGLQAYRKLPPATVKHLAPWPTPTVPQTCIWCEDGFIQLTGVMCHACQGTGKTMEVSCESI